MTTRMITAINKNTVRKQYNTCIKTQDMYLTPRPPPTRPPPTRHMRKHEKFISEAAHEANKSQIYHQHGCVIVCNGRIVAKGHNHSRCTSSDGLIKDTCTCHAEIAALRSLGNTYCKGRRGDHRYWVQRGKVSKARKKSYDLHSSSCG